MYQVANSQPFIAPLIEQSVDAVGDPRSGDGGLILTLPGGRWLHTAQQKWKENCDAEWPFGPAIKQLLKTSKKAAA